MQYIVNFIAAHWIGIGITYAILAVWTAFSDYDVIIIVRKLLNKAVMEIPEKKRDWIMSIWIFFAQPFLNLAKKIHCQVHHRIDRLHWLKRINWNRLAAISKTLFYPAVYFLIAGFVILLIAVILTLVIIAIAVVIAIIAMKLLVHILLWPWNKLKGAIERKEMKRYNEQTKARREKEAEEKEVKRVENTKRSLSREAWFKDNPPKLYFATRLGITAVLKPADYEAAKRLREDLLTDEKWIGNALYPSPKTLVFVTKLGYQQLFAAHKVEIAIGWLSDLRAICDEMGCELISDVSIFVPYTGEGILSYEEQDQNFSYCSMQNREHIKSLLIDQQAPREMWPLQID